MGWGFWGFFGLHSVIWRKKKYTSQLWVSPHDLKGMSTVPQQRVSESTPIFFSEIHCFILSFAPHSKHEFRSAISPVFSLFICKFVILTLQCFREVFWELLNRCLHFIFRASYQSNSISIKLFYWKKLHKAISGLATKKPHCLL